MGTIENEATLYIDDSGTHDESLIAVASAYIVNRQQVQPFETNWQEIGNLEGFKAFHMADFEGRYDEFANGKWDDETKRKRTLNRLLSIARARSRYCIFIAVDRKAYTDIILTDSRLTKKFGRLHYTFAVRALLDHVKTWRKKFAPESRLRYIFDQMSKGKGEILETFDRLRKKPNMYGIVRSGYCFEDKRKVVQLQAADILAWHTYQHMCETVLRNLPVRPAMVQIMEMPYKDGLYDRDALQRLAEHAKALLGQQAVK